MNKRTYCMADDRPDDISLRLALLSLRAQCPSARLTLFRPEPTAEFLKWIRGFPKVSLVPYRPEGATSWNCKPQALLTLLDLGSDEVIWLDSDLAFTRPFDHLFDALPVETLVAAHDMRFPVPRGTLVRTKGWNLPVGKSYPETLNTCVLRVTQHHRPLLLRWRELMADPRYQAAQTLPTDDRPCHLRSDQDVLNAIIGSQEFSDIPVRFLKRGRDIIHCSARARSYSSRERLLGLISPIAPILHNPSLKACSLLDFAVTPKTSSKFSERLFLEISPYMATARLYEAELAPNTGWLHYRTPLGSMLRVLSFGHYAMAGMPLVGALSVLRLLQSIGKRDSSQLAAN